VIDGVLLKPLPYPHPEQLVGLWHRATGLNNDLWNMSSANYFIYREQGRAFQDVGLYNAEDSVSITGAGQPEQVRAIDVTDGVLPILGVPPLLGRRFNRHDDSPGSPQTAILSYRYWRQKFGSSPDVIGRTVTVDGRPPDRWCNASRVPFLGLGRSRTFLALSVGPEPDLSRGISFRWSSAT
jgi:MacB-like periplasmic core domain